MPSQKNVNTTTVVTSIVFGRCKGQEFNVGAVTICEASQTTGMVLAMGLGIPRSQWACPIKNIVQFNTVISNSDIEALTAGGPAGITR